MRVSRGASACPQYQSAERLPRRRDHGVHEHPLGGGRTTAWHHDQKDPDIHSWFGGQVDGMRDASGQMYMRNRYYDPATGQFTQPNSIGLAGAGSLGEHCGPKGCSRG